MAQINSRPISEPDVPQLHYYDLRTLLFMQVTLYLSTMNKIFRTPDSNSVYFYSSLYVRISVHIIHNDLRLHIQRSTSKLQQPESCPNSKSQQQN